MFSQRTAKDQLASLLANSDGSVGRLFDMLLFMEIPVNKRPLLPPLPENQIWVLLHRNSQTSEYPEIASAVPADLLIVGLREIFYVNLFIKIKNTGMLI